MKKLPNKLFILSIIFISLFSTNLTSLTWKSDGSVVNNSGQLIKPASNTKSNSHVWCMNEYGKVWRSKKGSCGWGVKKIKRPDDIDYEKGPVSMVGDQIYYDKIKKDTVSKSNKSLNKKNNKITSNENLIRFYPSFNGFIFSEDDPNSKFLTSYESNEEFYLYNINDDFIDNYLNNSDNSFNKFWPVISQNGQKGFISPMGILDFNQNKDLFINNNSHAGNLKNKPFVKLSNHALTGYWDGQKGYEFCYYEYESNIQYYWEDKCYPVEKLADNPFVKILKIKLKTTEKYDNVPRSITYVYVEFYDKSKGWIGIDFLDKKSFIANVLFNSNEAYVVKNVNESIDKSQPETNSIKNNIERYIMEHPKLYVNADVLNIRDSKNGNIIDKTYKNQKLVIIEKQGGWSKIITNKGKEGWVSSQYLSSEIDNKNDYVFCWNSSSVLTTLNFNKIIPRKGQCLAKETKIQKDLICKNKSLSAKKLLEECAKFSKNTEIVKIEPKKTESEIINENKVFEIELSSNQIADEIAPKITCDKIGTINSSLANIKCKISDDNELFAVVVNGRQIEGNLENLNEQIQVPFGNSKIEVVAYDFFGNKENLILNVNREFSLVNSQEEIEQLFPGKIKDKSSNNKVAVIIGIQNYADIPDTKYSDKDAMAFAEFANQTLNIPSKNIKYLFNEDAKYFGFKGIQTWLENKVNKNTDVYVFYSGHGLGVEGKSKLLPSDFVTQFQEESSYEKDEFLSDIANLKPNHIYAFFDTCFSGLGRNGETLVAGLKNISIVEETAPVDNITIFNSSSGLEYSTDFDEAGHGLFSYYLMKGLEGNADINADNEITSKELFSFISDNVSDRALDIGLSQNPSLIGKSNNVIVRW